MGEFRGRVRARQGELKLDVSFDTHGGRLAIVGPNGAGKSSFLKALIGALEVDDGWVEAGSRRLVDTTAGIVVPMEKRRLGYLPQSYALFPHLTVRQNIEFPILRRGLPSSERRQRVEVLLEQVGVRHVASKSARSLSGGEMQRVALARALASEPEVLLLDEPLAAMDVSHRDEVQTFLLQYLTQLRLPTLVVTHDASEAQLLGEQVMVLENGIVTQAGSFAALRATPATPFIARFTRSAAG